MVAHRRSKLPNLSKWFAVTFAVADFVWMLLILGVSAATGLQSIDLASKATAGVSGMMSAWNVIHFPVHLLLEPIFFASTSSNPGSPSIMVVVGYLLVGVLWLALVGWLLGSLLARRARA